MDAQVVTVTLNPAIDETCEVDALIPERKLDAKELRRYPGGGGVNVARAVSRLGGRALALWSHHGETSELLGRLLDEEGVPWRPVPVQNAIRENFIVRDRATGQHYRFNMPGPYLSGADQEAWKHALESLSPTPDFLVVSGSLPPDTPLSWFADLIQAAPIRTRVVVDTKRAALSSAIAQGIFLIKPNIHELEEISETPLDDEESIRRAALRLIHQGHVQVVLVSMGRGGALLVTSEDTLCISAPAVPFRSKVGAGDSMVAGVVTALARGWPVVEAARFGVAAGSAAVMTAGTELCNREDAERIYRHLR